MFLSPGARSRARPVTATISQGLIPSGRLTLTSNVPITSTDVTAATTVYFTPYGGRVIELFNGAFWQLYTFSQIALSISGFAANTNFDVWARPVGSNNIAVDTTAWSSDTTRAVALTTLNGIDVKSTDFTRRLIGTFRTTGSVGQTEDSVAKRFVSNPIYSSVPRVMNVNDATATWNYSTAAWRQVNASTANQLDMVCCSARPVQVISTGQVTSTAAVNCAIGVGIDSVPAASAALNSLSPSVTAAGTSVNLWAYYAGTPGAGRHFITWIEYGGGSGTQTWLGTVLPWVQTGITGVVSN